MIIEVNDGQILAGSAVNLSDFPETTKVLLDHFLLVEGRRNVPALQDGAVGGGHAPQALRAISAGAASHRGGDPAGVRVWGFG